MEMERKRIEAKFPCYWSCQCAPPTPHTNVQIRTRWWWWLWRWWRWWWWWWWCWSMWWLGWWWSAAENSRISVQYLPVCFWCTFSLGKPKIHQNFHLKLDTCWCPFIEFYQQPCLPSSQLDTKACAIPIHNFVNFHFSSENPWFAELPKYIWGNLQLPFNRHAQASTYFTKGVLNLKNRRSALGISWQ